MGTLSIAQICDAVAAWLDTGIASLVQVQSYDELTEDFPDCPMAQVYWQEQNTDAWRGGHAQTSFVGVTRQTDIEIVVDIPCRQRSHIDEDSKAVVVMADLLQTLLEGQKTKPYFALADLKAFHWSMERVVHTRGDPEIRYPGVRLHLWTRVF